MKGLNTLKEKWKEIDDKLFEKYMVKSVLESEEKRVEAYNKWLPLPIKIYSKLNSSYEIDEHDLTVPLPDWLYHICYVKQFSQRECRIIAETFHKYAKSNTELTKALEELHRFRGFSPYKRKLFYIVINIMVSEGAPIYTALDTVMGDLVDSKLIFSLEVGLISNRLERSLHDYIEDLDYDMANNSKVKRVLAYPTIIAIMIVVMCVAAKLYLIPELFEPLGLTGDKLPSELNGMMYVADLILKPYKLIKFIIAYIAFRFVYKNSQTFSTALDFVILSIPVVGDYLITKDICFFFRNLYSYVDAGKPTIDAHIHACETLKIATLKIIFTSKTKNITEGTSLSESYKEVTFLKEDLRIILGVAEKNGALEEALQTCTNMLKSSYQEVTDNLVEKIPSYSTLGAGAAIMILFMPLMGILYSLDKYIV